MHFRFFPSASARPISGRVSLRSSKPDIALRHSSGRRRPARRSAPPTPFNDTFSKMSAMSANFAVAPAHVRSTAAIRRAGRASAKRVIARGVIKAEAVKEAVALNTTKSDQVRTTSRPLLMCAFERGPGSRRSRLVATGPRGARPRRNRRSGIRNRDTIRYPETNNRGPRPRRERARSDPARDTAVVVPPKGGGAKISACISAFAGSNALALVRSIPPLFASLP